MKIKLEVEIDTEKQQDRDTVEELITMLRELAERFED